MTHDHCEGIAFERRTHEVNKASHGSLTRCVCIFIPCGLYFTYSLDGSTNPTQAMQQLEILQRLMSKLNGSLETRDVFELIGGVGISGSVLVGFVINSLYRVLADIYSFVVSLPFCSAIQIAPAPSASHS